MGNCQCQNDTALEFTDKKQQITVTPLVHPHKPQPLAQITKPPSHEPSPEFARQLTSFPELQKKIVETDQKLGQFKVASKQLWNQGYEPVHIKKAYKLHNGIIYEGQWHKGIMNGYGKFYLPDGSFVRGFSINNQLVGEARLIRENGNYYQGEVRNNKANGEGEMYENGVLYKGHFVDNYLEGNGSETCPNYSFVGKYHCGARIFGKLSWDLEKNPPTVYEGGFFDQQFNGEGKLSNEIGEYVGSFQNGKKKGRGVFTWKNGDRFEGMYDSDLKNGEGRMYNNKNVIVLHGYWQNDKFKI